MQVGTSQHPLRTVLDDMPFPDRLVALRKERGLSQQKLADLAGVHVVQLRRYEAGGSQPTLDALKRIALALSVSTDMLVFDPAERDPGDDLRLHFEALARLGPDERKLVKTLIESIVLTHDVRHSGVPTPQGAMSG